MTPRLSRTLGRWALLAALAAAGCAGLRPGGDDVRTLRDPQMTLAQASALVRPGHSTQAEVAAALGPAAVVRFGSGQEIWVWRSRVAPADSQRRNPPRAELIVLFSPAGIAQKARIRQADGTG